MSDDTKCNATWNKHTCTKDAGHSKRHSTFRNGSEIASWVDTSPGIKPHAPAETAKEPEKKCIDCAGEAKPAFGAGVRPGDPFWPNVVCRDCNRVRMLTQERDAARAEAEKMRPALKERLRERDEALAEVKRLRGRPKRSELADALSEAQRLRAERARLLEELANLRVRLRELAK